MWSAIQHVTTALSLAAFVAAAIVTVLRFLIDRDRKLIETVPEDQRGPIVARILGAEEIAKSTPKQQMELAKRRLQDRSRRFMTIAIVIVIVALIAGAVSIFALTTSQREYVTENFRTSLNAFVNVSNVFAPGLISRSFPSSTDSKPSNAEAKVVVTLKNAFVMVANTGVVNPADLPKAGWPSISDYEKAEIKATVENQLIVNRLKPFFSAAPTGGSTSCDLTFRVWNDSNGFPERDSFRLDGAVDQYLSDLVVATIETIQFPTPVWDKTDSTQHMSYYEIKINVQATFSGRQT